LYLIITTPDPPVPPCEGLGAVSEEPPPPPPVFAVPATAKVFVFEPAPPPPVPPDFIVCAPLTAPPPPPDLATDAPVIELVTPSPPSP